MLPRGQQRAQVAVHARLEQLVAERVEERVDRAASAAAAAASQRSSQRAVRARRRAARRTRSSSSAGSARAIRSAVEVGSFHAPSGSITTCRQSGCAASHVRTAFEVTMSPTRITSSGASALRQVAEDRVVAGDDQLAVVRARSAAARSARPGPGSRRRGRAPPPAVASAGSRWRPARITPRSAARDTSSANAPTSSSLGRRDRPRHRGRAASARGGPRGPAGLGAVTSPSTGSGASGSVSGTFRCTGPGGRAARLGDRTHRRRAIVEQPRVVGLLRRRARRTSAPPSRTASAGRSSGRRPARAAPAGGRP